MHRIFTDEQEQYILDNYKNMSYKDIAKNLGNNFTNKQVSCWLSKKGLKQGKIKTAKHFTEEEKQYIKDHYLTDKYKDIASVVNATTREVMGWVNHNLPRKVRTFNNRYFQYIDTPTKAYWLGFIYADGWISHSQDRGQTQLEFGMKLQARDLKALQDLNNELGGVHSITPIHIEKKLFNRNQVTISNCYSLRVYSRPLVRDLMSHSITFNKSHNPIYPEIEEKYFFDFLRGYIDGDGCISDGIITRNEKRSSLSVTIVSKNREVLDYIGNYIFEHYQISFSVLSQHDCWLIHWYCGNALKVLDLCYYDDSVQKLQRKYDRYLTIKAAISEYEMKKSGNIGEGLAANTEISEKIA